MLFGGYRGLVAAETRTLFTPTPPPNVTRRHRPALAIGAVALCVVAVAGCSKAEQKPSSATSAPPPTSSSATVTPSATSATPSVTATKPASFNGTCDDLLPVSTLDDALGRPIIGQTAFIVGVPEPNIGRLAYLNCRYGITKVTVAKKVTTATKIEIGISLYGTSAHAASRVSGTVEDYRSHGAAPTVTAVGQYSGTTLIGYGDPTLVVAAGPRTVAVTMSAKLVATGQSSALAALAKAALDATDKFSQGGPAATPSVS